MIPTRLDPLLKLKEREEQQRQIQLAAASRALMAAEAKVTELQERAAKGDALAAGPVENWVLREEAHQRALRDLQAARAAVAAADKACRTARTACVEAKKAVDIFRNATERKRAELLHEIERREQKTLEEMARLLHHS